MSKLTCIYCEKVADSREHLFPASCGGLKTSFDILCGDCNQRFGEELDTSLYETLLLLNSILGVQNRNREKQTILLKEEGTGKPFLMDHCGNAKSKNVETIEHSVSEHSKNITVRASSQKELDDWLADFKKKGGKFKRNTNPRPVKVNPPKQLTQELSFGGELFFRETARIALNFLAWVDPKLVRTTHFDTIKTYIKGNSSIKPVDHSHDTVGPLATHTIQPCPFRFGHRIFLVFSPKTEEVFAYVSYFGTIHFLIEIASLPNIPEKTIVIDIDPLAQCQPHDIKVNNYNIALEKYPVYQKNQEEQYYSEIEVRLNRLFSETRMYQLEQLVNECAQTIAQNTEDNNALDAYPAAHLALTKFEFLIYPALEVELHTLARKALDAKTISPSMVFVAKFLVDESLRPPGEEIGDFLAISAKLTQILLAKKLSDIAKAGQMLHFEFLYLTFIGDNKFVEDSVKNAIKDTLMAFPQLPNFPENWKEILFGHEST